MANSYTYLVQHRLTNKQEEFIREFKQSHPGRVATVRFISAMCPGITIQGAVVLHDQMFTSEATTLGDILEMAMPGNKDIMKASR